MKSEEKDNKFWNKTDSVSCIMQTRVRAPKFYYIVYDLQWNVSKGYKGYDFG